MSVVARSLLWPYLQRVGTEDDQTGKGTHPTFFFTGKVPEILGVSLFLSSMEVFSLRAKLNKSRRLGVDGDFKARLRFTLAHFQICVFYGVVGYVANVAVFLDIRTGHCWRGAAGRVGLCVMRELSLQHCILLASFRTILDVTNMYGICSTGGIVLANGYVSYLYIALVLANGTIS